LTAGIAHDLQNPLNFVNNFSEVNKEMIQQLQTELKAGYFTEAINISNDLKANEEKNKSSWQTRGWYLVSRRWINRVAV
jgi:signal transduction histidine kinase